MSEDARPEILPVETEREILFGRLVSSLSSTSLNPDLTVAGGWHIIAGTAVVGVLRQLQVMSAPPQAALHPLNPDLTVAGGWHIIAGTAVVGVLRQLQVMSARQLAVLLADEANRHEGWVIHEPPRYTAEEIDDAR